MHHLQSLHLSGLLPQDAENQPPRLEQLILNNTGVDDDATPYLACCPNLVVLELAGTKISSKQTCYLGFCLVVEVLQVLVSFLLSTPALNYKR